MKRGHFILLIIALLLSAFIFESCKATQATTEIESTKPTGPQILFVTYKFNGNTLEFINKKVTSGKFKSRPDQNSQKVNGDLILVQLSEEKLVLDGLTIPNPRVKVVEYADDNGVFQKKSVMVEDAEFTARINLHADTKFLMVKEVNDESSELLIMNLTELD